MVTIDDYKQMAFTFLQEACRRLNINDGMTRMLFIPSLPSNNGIPQFSQYSLAENTIFVSEVWLKSLIPGNLVTLLRSEIYVRARVAFQLSVKRSQSENLIDAMAFSLALLGIKGLRLTFPNDAFKTMVLAILRDEFHFDAVTFDVPIETIPGKKDCVLQLSKTAEDQIYDKLSPKPQSTIVGISSKHKGTKDDPFDNIDDAFEHIDQLEKAAYDNDSLLNEIADSDCFYDFDYRQFRYPFASSYVTNYRNNFPKNCFIVNQNSVNPKGKRHFTLKPNLYRRKFLYRGQNEDYAPNPCVPNLFRDCSKEYFLDDMIWTQEMELLLISHPLVRQLEEGIELLHDQFSFYMNLGGLAQHYYHKTTFLDFTSNADVAKFFAVTCYNRDNDTYYAFAPTDKLGVIYCYELQYPGPFVPRHNCHLSVIGKQVFMRSGAQHGFLLDMNKGVDLKKHPLVHAIYFRHDQTVSDRIFKQSGNGKEYFAIDLLEKIWKQEYRQKMEDGIVSSAAVRINVSRNPGETYESICKKLKEKGITVDNSYSPHFPKELLDEYYQDIKNGWWENFCQDIYFYGADGLLYKDALLHLPSDDRYHSAFTKSAES